MRVLVTGAAGFVGRHLVWRLISSGDEVVALVSPGADTALLETYGTEIRRAQCTAPEALHDLHSFEAIYHLKEQMSTDADALERINVALTERLLSHCAQCASPPTVVLLSSLAASGPTPIEGTPRTEADPPDPRSPYGRSKLAAEEVARGYAQRLSITIVRPSVLFGDGDKETLPLFKHALRGRVRVPAQLDQRVSLVHVADLAHVMEVACLHGERLTAEGPMDQGVYFVSTAETPTFDELLGMLRKVFEVPITTSGLFGGLMDRIRGNSTTLNPRAITAGSWLVDGSKARDTLPLRLRMTLEQRLTRTLNWYKDEGWL